MEGFFFFGQEGTPVWLEKEFVDNEVLFSE